MNRVAGRYLWGNERLEIKGLDSIRHTFLLLAIEQTSVLSERHWYYTQVTHCFLCHFEVSLPLQGVEMRVSLCGRVKSVSVWVCVGTGFLGLVPFPLQIYKHPVFLVTKRILGIRGCPNNWKQGFRCKSTNSRAGEADALLMEHMSPPSPWLTWLNVEVKKAIFTAYRAKKSTSLWKALTVLHHPLCYIDRSLSNANAPR